MSSQIRKIVVPMDFSDVSERAALYAESIARSLNAALYLVHVQPSSASTPHSLDPVSAGADSREQRYHAALEHLEGLARRFASPTLRVTTEVRTGETAESIAQASRHYGADLVIMGTHGRTGMAHLLAGSIAEKVIRTAPCPVLVVGKCGNVHVRGKASTKVA